jgi:S1-C subfamily serine protease
MSIPDRYADSYAPRRSIWPFVLLVLVAGMALWLWRSHRSSEEGATPRVVTARGDLAGEEKTAIDIFRKVSPSVVHITTLAAQQDLFGMETEQVPQGTGSGFMWDDEGHIVTNYHVIRSAVEGQDGAAKVVLADSSTWEAKWARFYPDADLAVLGIDAPKSRLHPIPIGTSHDLQVGQDAFAIGNPFGLDHTLTKGIISALNRQIESVTQVPIKEVIQTDAAVNPGNSGGPLLDSAGRLIGVTTAIVSRSGASAGIGFAIPVDEVNRIVPQLIQHGKVVHPDLGAQIADDQLAERLGIEGALVLRVRPGSPAAKAGLRPVQRTDTGQVVLGDVIVAVAGQAVSSKSEYYAALDQHKAGEKITLTVLRGDQRMEISVTLESSS